MLKKNKNLNHSAFQNLWKAWGGGRGRESTLIYWFIPEVFTVTSPGSGPIQEPTALHVSQKQLKDLRHQLEPPSIRNGRVEPRAEVGPWTIIPIWEVCVLTYLNY